MILVLAFFVTIGIGVLYNTAIEFGIGIANFMLLVIGLGIAGIGIGKLALVENWYWNYYWKNHFQYYWYWNCYLTTL